MPENIEVGDVVAVNIHTTYPHPTHKLGSFEAYVTAAGIELQVQPLEWDKACDLLSQEGSMSWTEIRELRSSNHLDCIQYEEVCLLRKRKDLYRIEATVLKSRDSDAEDELANNLVGLFKGAGYTLKTLQVGKVV